MSSLSELLPAGGGAGGTVEATASGALSNGDMVVVNSDGTVSVVSGTQYTQSTGSKVTFETDRAQYLRMTYNPDQGRVVIIYSDYGDGGRALYVVGTVSGTSISFTSPAWQNSGKALGNGNALINNPSVANRIISLGRYVENSYYPEFKVGAVSSSSVSWQSSVIPESAAHNQPHMAYVGNGKIVYAYRSNNNNRGYARVGTTTSSSVSFGTAVQFESGSTEYPTVIWDSDNDKVVIAFKDSSSLDGKAIVGTVSGTSITFGTAVTFTSSNIYWLSGVYDENTQKVVLAYRDGNNSNKGTAVVGTVSGTSISFGSASVYNTAEANYNAVTYDSAAKKVVINYQDAGISNANELVVGTVSGTDITFDTPVEINADNTNIPDIAYDSVNGKIIVAYEDVTNTAGAANVFQVPYADTNLTTDNFIGIADADYSDAATAVIQIAGGVDDAQSSLTAGQEYYLQLDGTLATTADASVGEVLVGTALSSTELLIKGN